MAEGLVRVTVWAPYGTAARLRALVDADRERRRVLESDDPRWDVAGLNAEARAEVRLALAAWRAQARERGELLDTSGAVLTWGVRGELVARGWADRVWPAAPETALAGRWWGSQASGWPEKIGAGVEAGLVEKVRAACWWTSLPAITELRRWRDAHPERVPERLSTGESNPVHAEYTRLAGRVTVPGDVWRAALVRVLGEPGGDRSDD